MSSEVATRPSPFPSRQTQSEQLLRDLCLSVLFSFPCGQKFRSSFHEKASSHSASLSLPDQVGAHVMCILTIIISHEILPRIDRQIDRYLFFNAQSTAKVTPGRIKRYQNVKSKKSKLLSAHNRLKRQYIKNQIHYLHHIKLKHPIKKPLTHSYIHILPHKSRNVPTLLRFELKMTWDPKRAWSEACRFGRSSADEEDRQAYGLFIEINFCAKLYPFIKQRGKPPKGI